jgi:putative hemolysin
MRKSIIGFAALLILGTGGSLWPTSGWASSVSTTVAIRVEQVGGFVGPNFKSARLPEVIVYTDGRILAQRILNSPVREMFEGYVSISVLQAQRELFVRAIKMPVGGWGTPTVTDVPSTQIFLLHNGKKTLANVYALNFNSTNLSKEAITARTFLSKSIAALTKLAGQTKVYKPTAYEVWPAWIGTGGTTTDSGDPAAQFCISQNGTVVAGKVQLDSPTPAPNLSVYFCQLSDGSFQDEWAYFHRVSTTGLVWPARIPRPTGRCTRVRAREFASLLPTAANKQWLFPNGAMVNLTWRPILPGEIACRR